VVLNKVSSLIMRTRIEAPLLLPHVTARYAMRPFTSKAAPRSVASQGLL
jgi:hypothetical protein